MIRVRVRQCHTGDSERVQARSEEIRMQATLSGLKSTTATDIDDDQLVPASKDRNIHAGREAACARAKPPLNARTLRSRSVRDDDTRREEEVPVAQHDNVRVLMLKAVRLRGRVVFCSPRD
jgi:hypothetical protein